MSGLLIAIPTFDTLRAEFVRSLIALTEQLHEDGIGHQVKILNGTLVYMARDRLANYAVGKDFREVLWIDSDMVFDGYIYSELTRHGKDMICGSYISRHYPYSNGLFSSLDPAKSIEKTGKEPIQIAGCGFGCVLMKTQVIKDVKESTGGKIFLPEENMGEDLTFCKRATACGHEIWCDPTVEIGHVGSIMMWPGDAEKLLGHPEDISGIGQRRE